MRNGFLKLMNVCLVATIMNLMLSSMVSAQQPTKVRAVDQSDAEDGNSPSRPSWFPGTVEQSDAKAGSTRSPGLAVGLSLGSTVLFSAIGGGMLAAHAKPVKIAGGVLLGTGLVFGPAVGQAYSDRWGRATLFSLGRAAAGAVGVGGFFWTFAAGFGGGSTAPGIILMVSAGIAETGLVIWGITDSYKSANQYNEEHAKKSISLSPFVMPSSGRNGEKGTAYGLAVAGNF